MIATNKIDHTQMWNPILTVDNDEWYFGRQENLTNKEKRILVKQVVKPEAIISNSIAKSINEYFLWLESHEKDTVKKKKRPFYVDRGFFINQDFSF